MVIQCDDLRRDIMKKRNLQVEGLRGIGLLCILVFHFFMRYDQIYHEGHTNEILQLLPIIGVFTFCLISGLYIDHHDDKDGGVKWFAYRVLKIWPAYMIAITLVFFITRFIELPGRTVNFIEYLLNIPFVNGFIGKPYVDEAHWYLTTLIACLFWACFTLRIHSFKKRQYIYMLWMIVITALFLIRTCVHNTKLLTLTITLLGGEYSIVILCGIFLGRLDHPNLKNLSGCLMAVVCIGFIFNWVRALILVILCAIVYIAHLQKCSFLASKPIVVLGRQSFETYLIHQNLGYLIMYSLEKEHIMKPYNALIAITVVIISGLVLSKINSIILKQSAIKELLKSRE